MDFGKYLKTLNSVSLVSLKNKVASKGSPMPADPTKNEAPIYRPVSITMQVERHRLDLIAKSKK